MTERLTGISTNIITGFLGAGKSTAILNLLKSKPESERWAILVNEFGEVGIDGGLLSSGGDGNVFVREVPGGCMCCTAGLPMQMALNMLLARARPDRLIIEPTGLGHPFEVVNVLSTEYYRDVLDVRTTLTLVDARKISDERYTNHATFNEQLEIADVIVASKSDLYDDEDLTKLKRYLESKGWLARRKLVEITRGDLSIDWLQQEATTWQFEKAVSRSGPIESGNEPGEVLFPPEGFIRLTNMGEGFTSHGWIFDPSFVFDRQTVSQFLKQISAERIKALLRTSEGNFGFNFAGDTIEESRLRTLDDSRIEIITSGDSPATEFENQLLAAAESS